MLDPPANHALLADGQLAHQIFAMTVEEHEHQPRAVVMAAHLIGQPPVGRRQMGIDGDGQRDDHAFGRIGQFRGEAAVDDAGRQMPARLATVRPDQVSMSLPSRGPMPGRVVVWAKRG